MVSNMGKHFTVDWSTADWRKQDVALAAELGCTRERVRQARNDPRLGNGARSLRHRRRTAVTSLDRLAAMNTEGRTLPELARLAGCGKRNAAMLLKRLGQGFRRRPRGNARYDWARFPSDWEDRTDKEIAAVVGVDNPAVVTQWRNRHGFRKQCAPPPEPRKPASSHGSVERDYAVKLTSTAVGPFRVKATRNWTPFPPANTAHVVSGIPRLCA